MRSWTDHYVSAPTRQSVWHTLVMAQKTQVTLIDDVDGSEATQTVTFAFQGVSYEIDLNDDHASALEESFGDWISSARRVSGVRGGRSQRSAANGRSGARAASSGRDLNDVRAWLRSQGHQVADRGRISQMLLDDYDKAH